MKLRLTFAMLSIAAMTTLNSCGSARTGSDEILADTQIEILKKEFAPDRRVAMFDVEAESQNGRLVIKGETDQPKAAEMLRTGLQAQDIAFLDSLIVLPSADLQGKKRYR